MSREELPVIAPADVQSSSTLRSGPIVGVVLAAGGSTRYGERNKLLVEVEGTPIVRRSVEAFLAASLPVIVVTGSGQEDVEASLSSLGVTVRENPDWESGQSTSVREGLSAAIDQGADAVVFGLGDMPWVDPATIELLVETYRRSEAPCIAAAHEGVRGNPVLFAAETFDALRDLTGDTGGREILLGRPDAVAIETGDPGVRRDVDRPDDLSPD